MRNIFTKVFAVAAMMVMSLTAFADTAIVSWQMGVDGADATSANSITGATGCAAEGFTIAITGNTGKSWTSNNTPIEYGGVNYKHLKNSNGAQNTITLPSGHFATRVQFYATTNNADANGVLSEFNGEHPNDQVTSRLDCAHPTIITKELNNVSSFTFTFSSQQVFFIAVIDYHADGTTYTNTTKELKVIKIGESDYDIASGTTINAEYNLVPQVKYIYTVKKNWSDASYTLLEDDEETITAVQNGANYEAASTKLDENITLIFTNVQLGVFRADCTQKDVVTTSLSGYLTASAPEYVISETAIKSANNVISKTGTYYDGSSMEETVSAIRYNLAANMAEASPVVYAFTAEKDFLLTGIYPMAVRNSFAVECVIKYSVNNLDEETIHTVTTKDSYTEGKGGYKAIKAGDVIRVKMYLKNTDATNERAAAMYRISFTYTDYVAQSFGMGRKFADATTFEEGVEKLMGSVPEHVTVAIENGAEQTHTFSNCTVKHGTDDAYTAPTAYQNYGANNEFSNDLYWGFSVAIESGYTLSISQIYGDFYAEKNAIQYKMGVYSSDATDAAPIYMSDIKSGTITNMGAANVPTTVDTREVAALQGLTGTIYCRFYWCIASSSAKAALKDFNITATLVETDPIDPASITGLGATRSVSGNTITSNYTKVGGEVEHVTVSNLTYTYEYANNFTGNLYHGSETAVTCQDGANNTVFRNRINNDTYIKTFEDAQDNNTYVAFDLTVEDGYQMQITSIASDVYPGDKNVPYYYAYAIEDNSGDEVYRSDAFEVHPQTSTDNLEKTIDLKHAANLNGLTGTVRVKFYWWVNSNGTYLLLRDFRVNAVFSEKHSYTRTHAHMNLNTLCFPYTVTAYTGGTFYTMLYKRVENSVPVEVVLEEHEGNLVAGTPYFYMPEGSQLELTYSGHRENTPSKVNGVQGIYDEQTVPTGSYVTYNGEIRAVGNNVTLKEYRAYVDMNAVSEEVIAPAPGKKLLRIRNADAPAVITDIDQITNDKSQITNKILRNGQLFIIRDGKVYNAQGQTVK